MFTNPQKASRQSCTGLLRISALLGLLLSPIGTSSVEASPFSGLESTLRPFAGDIRLMLEPSSAETNRTRQARPLMFARPGVAQRVGESSGEVSTPAGWEPSAHSLLHGQRSYDFSELERSINDSTNVVKASKSLVEAKDSAEEPIRKTKVVALPKIGFKAGASVPDAPEASAQGIRLRFRLGGEPIQEGPSVPLDKDDPSPDQPAATITLDKP